MLQQSSDLRMSKKQKFRPDPIKSPWAAEVKDAPLQPFRLSDHASVFYDRAVPDPFTEEKDDRLMNSLIFKYSVEGNSGGRPNGNFYLEKDGARNVAMEVVGTHFGFTGDKAK